MRGCHRAAIPTRSPADCQESRKPGPAQSPVTATPKRLCACISHRPQRLSVARPACPNTKVRSGQRETDNQTCGRTSLAARFPSKPSNLPKRPALTLVLWQPKRSNCGARHTFPGGPSCKADPRQTVQMQSGNTALEPFHNQWLAAILRIGHVRCFFSRMLTKPRHPRNRPSASFRKKALQPLIDTLHRIRRNAPSLPCRNWLLQATNCGESVRSVRSVGFRSQIWLCSVRWRLPRCDRRDDRLRAWSRGLGRPWNFIPRIRTTALRRRIRGHGTAIFARI